MKQKKKGDNNYNAIFHTTECIKYKLGVLKLNTQGKQKPAFVCLAMIKLLLKLIELITYHYFMRTGTMGS